MLFSLLTAVTLTATTALAVPAPIPNPLPLAEPNYRKTVDGVPQYHLQTQVQGQDGGDTNNLLISTFHTGAGLNAAVGTPTESMATAFQTLDDKIGFLIGQDNGREDITYAFGIPHVSAYMSNAPDSYSVVSISVLNQTTGFHLQDDFVQPPADSGFKSFAMCYVKGIPPYVSVGPQYQLFWKDQTSAVGAENCADVKLKALYLNK